MYLNVADNMFFLLFLLSQVMYLEQLLACVDVLLHECDSDCGSVSLQLLQVLVTVQSLSTEPQLSEKARNPLLNLLYHLLFSLPGKKGVIFCVIPHFCPDMFPAFLDPIILCHWSNLGNVSILQG